jgi:hypothetical protein
MGFNLDLQRKAVRSDDYAAKLANVPKLSHADKTKRLFAILSDKQGGLQRLGAAMIGPIQVRLRYEGIVRNVLLEDPLEKGPVLPYDVLDDLGQAYVMNKTDGEVKITPFEGKQVRPELFRVATFPRIRKEDLYFLRVNAIEFVQDESRQAIMKQEDNHLIGLLSAAITDYETVTGVSVTQSIGVGNPLEVVDFYEAVKILELRQIEPKRILINPADLRDMYTWDVNVTGWKFKDTVFGGQTITEFGEFTIQKSIIVPQGTIFVLPEPNWLGVMPVMYSLDVEENNNVETFWRGWVMDEMIGMLVLNPRGLAVIKKA